MASITVAQRESLIALYVGMFKAAPGSANLSTMVQSYEAGKTLKEIAVELDSASFRTVYPAFLTAEEFADRLVANLLGSDVGSQQTTWATNWVKTKLNSGVADTDVIVEAVNALRATTNTAYATAQSTMTNKVTVASYYSIDKAQTSDSLSTLQGVISSVTSDSTTVDTAKTSIDTASAPASQAFTLTTGVDSFTGDSADDTFTADNTGTDQTSTADKLDGAGGTDTISVFSDGAAFALPQLTAIEKAIIYDQDADLNIGVNTWASVNDVTMTRSDGAFTLTVGANVGTITLEDHKVATGGLGLTLNAATTTSTLNLSGISTAGAAADEDITFTGAGLKTVIVNTTGSASSVDELDVAAASAITINADEKFTTQDLATTSTAATLTITGDSAVSLGTLNAGINTVTASANTGGLTAAIGAATDTVLTGSAGNDTITASTTDTIASTEKLSVDAGDGTDTLILGDANDVNTSADGARYKNFEKLSTSATQDVSLISGITALIVGANTSQTFSKLSSTVAGDITITADNTTSSIFTLASSTGTSDSITFNLASTTATTNVDVIGISVVGIEEVNINATTGTNGTESDFGFLADSADNVKTINITGTADVKLNQVANTFDTVAVTIDASQLSGTADFELTGGVLISGSKVTGSVNGDTIAVSSTTGTTYDGGAGNDTFSASVADLVATGADDNKIDGGEGTDTLSVDDGSATLTDNHFTFVSNMETLTTAGTGSTSITTGGSFNSAYASGVTITTGALVDTSTYTLNAGLYSQAVTLTVSGGNLVGNAAGEDVTVTTGGGADKITVTAGAFTGATGGDGGAITVSTGAGDDAITVTVGTAGTQTTSNLITLTPGAGADTITKTGTNSTTAFSNMDVVIAAGDSATTARDKITGFDVADGTNVSDKLDFAGTAAVSTFTNTVDSGVILSHSITNGVVQFDDAATFSTAIVINASNLSDVLTYLATNTATNDTVAFAYDSDSSGTADATMVFHNGTTDDLVELTGVTGVAALTATETTTTANYIAIA